MQKIRGDAKIPKFAYAEDAGMDVYACEDTILQPGGHAWIATGLKLAIPAGHAGLVWDKSGIAGTYRIKTLGGVIDTNYRGELKVALVNLGEKSYEVKRGEKIAQLLIQPVTHPDIIEVDLLEETDRGEGGFGSTGKK